MPDLGEQEEYRPRSRLTITFNLHKVQNKSFKSKFKLSFYVFKKKKKIIIKQDY